MALQYGRGFSFLVRKHRSQIDGHRITIVVLERCGAGPPALQILIAKDMPRRDSSEKTGVIRNIGVVRIFVRCRNSWALRLLRQCANPVEPAAYHGFVQNFFAGLCVACNIFRKKTYVLRGVDFNLDIDPLRVPLQLHSTANLRYHHRRRRAIVRQTR